MDREPDKLHIRGKISEREGLTRQPSLKGMYSTRYNRCPKDNGTHAQMDTAPSGPLPPLITSLQAWQPNNIRRQKEKEKKGTV